MKTTRFTHAYPRAGLLPAAALFACLAVPGCSLAGEGAAEGHAAAAHPVRPRPPVVVPHSQAGATFYARRFGVDELSVRYTASGSLLEFRYRVVDPAKAQALGAAKAIPELIDQKRGTRLRVPEVEQVGALRQEGRLQEGREYWVMFPNPGKAIKPGDRVDIVIGTGFHVSGLVVE